MPLRSLSSLQALELNSDASPTASPVSSRRASRSEPPWFEPSQDPEKLCERLASSGLVGGPMRVPLPEASCRTDCAAAAPLPVTAGATTATQAQAPRAASAHCGTPPRTTPADECTLQGDRRLSVTPLTPDRLTAVMQGRAAGSAAWRQRYVVSALQAIEPAAATLPPVELGPSASSINAT